MFICPLKMIFVDQFHFNVDSLKILTCILLFKSLTLINFTTNPNFYYRWLLTLGITEGKAYGKQRFIPDDF